MKKTVLALILAMTLIMSSSVSAFADSGDTYVALGSDLTQEQKAVVLDIFGLSEADLDEIDTVEITNAMEHEILGSYLPDSVIGYKALSCVRVDKKKSGGIRVTTANISYCTEGMYKNALITAGIENADVIVAGPFRISGTAGLVGAMKAYQEMTGKEISEENADAAVEEIVTTGALAQEVGDSEDAENLVALAKQKVIAEGAKSDEEILAMIDEAASQIGLSLTDSEKQQLLKLLKKISQLDIDADTLKKQASDIYDRLKDLGVDMSDLDKDTVISGITKVLNSILDFIKGLFS